jgi:hypothetical protein
MYCCSNCFLYHCLCLAYIDVIVSVYVCRCAIYVKSKERDLVQQLVLACSVIRLAAGNSSMLLVPRLLACYVRRLAITWTMSNTAAIVNITTQNL